eukprot:SAG31_NODE_15630_length_745_cov_1.603715_2_plen_24_part_01
MVPLWQPGDRARSDDDSMDRAELV